MTFVSEGNPPLHDEVGELTGCVTAVRTDPESERPIAVELDQAGWILLAPNSPAGDYQWEQNHWYRVDGILGCDRERALRSRAERVNQAIDALPGSELLDDDELDMATCPDCATELDTGQTLQLEDPIKQLLETVSGQIYGLARDAVSIQDLGSEGAQWRPQESQAQRRQQSAQENADVVCSNCELDIVDQYQSRIAEARHRSQSNALEEHAGGIDDADSIVAKPGEPLDSINNNIDSSQSAAPDADVGMATGGAKDASNFRENIEDGHIPTPDALAYEGLFYDYYFDTGDIEGGDSLFYPSYARAVTEAPVSGEVEHYMTVGLNSNLTEADLERKPLNLVAVVDVSGSMNSPFDQYYYDEHGRRQDASSEASEETKMAAARRALRSLTEQLRPEDQLGVVLYNNSAHVAKPLRSVDNTNMDAIRDHIGSITSGGGTNMTAGFEAAMELLKPHHGADLRETENRVVFMTDAMPNLGTTNRDDITDAFADAADKHVHTTFVGIGLDANADLIESISGVRGANHYFINSTEEFETRLAEEFTYMVTPLVFDLSLDVVSEGYEIETVYGSPNADRATGEVMHVTTLFPSPTQDGETRGGVTLLKLTQVDPETSLELVANWTERDGTQGRDSTVLSFPTATSYFENNGIRKAVLLSRYGRLLREWMATTRASDSTAPGSGDDDWIPVDASDSTQWEQGSVPLTVSDHYNDAFELFRQHMQTEMELIGDETLQQDIDILSTLSNVDTGVKTGPASDLAEQEQARLRDIIELQPTSNGELQAAWDLDESAAVHHYLERALADLYYRDSGNMIRATDDAREHLSE